MTLIIFLLSIDSEDVKRKTKESKKCLKQEQKKIFDEFNESAKCILKLKQNILLSHKKRNSGKFAPQAIQKEIELCKNVITKLQTSAITKIELLKRLQDGKWRG